MSLEDFFVKAGIFLDSPESSPRNNAAAAPIGISDASFDANYGTGHAIGSSQQNNASAPIRMNGLSLDANYGTGHVIGSSQQSMLAPIQNNNGSMNANFGMTHVIGSSQQNMLAPFQNNNASMDANSGMGHVMVIGSSQQNMLTPMQNNNANFGMGHVMGIGVPGQQIVSNNLVSDNGYAAASGHPIFTKSETIMEGSSNGSQIGNGTDSLLEPGVAQNNRRIIIVPPEEVIERRRRRMIKNRESAARSRARKQAYTLELEFELNRLKQENAKLKQLVDPFKQVPRRKRSKCARKKVDRTKKTIRRTVSLGW